MAEIIEYDALLLVSFGGPEGPEDVMPFLKRVLTGRNVPEARMLEVAEHYYHFGGVSPLNDQNRALITALEARLAEDGPQLPIYFGNRNWHPLLEDTIQQMADDGVKRALAFVTSAYSSYSGCRQYREDIERARVAVGEAAPVIDKLRVFYNHPGFIQTQAILIGEALAQIPDERRQAARLVFTAHSIPFGMASNSNYEMQLRESCGLIADAVGHTAWDLVYQSRSGPPQMPWLEPDILDHMAALKAEGLQDLVVAPIGFLSDHMEVLFDLDYEAAATAVELEINMIRAATTGTHPLFVQMIRDLVAERVLNHPHRPTLGDHGPSHDLCPVNCCLPGSRPAGRPQPASTQ